MLPLLYLHGLSSLDLTPELEQFLGTSPGLSAATITRLTMTWQDEAKAFTARDLSGVDYVYVWADGTHCEHPPGRERLCLLVLIGVRADGTMELIALSDGYRESGRVLGRSDARRRTPWDAHSGPRDGRRRARVLERVGRGLPQVGAASVLVPQIANVLSALPKSAHPGANKALAEAWNAEDKDHARAAATAFEDGCGAKFPKAVAKIVDDLEQLLAFYDYPAEHWIHLRTTHPIESTFATVRPDQGRQGTGLQGRRHRHGVQADPGRPAPLARRQRPASGRPRASRRNLRQGETRRTRGTRSLRRSNQTGHRGRLIKIPHPQVLTIAPPVSKPTRRSLIDCPLIRAHRSAKPWTSRRTYAHISR